MDSMFSQAIFSAKRLIMPLVSLPSWSPFDEPSGQLAILNQNLNLQEKCRPADHRTHFVSPSWPSNSQRRRPYRVGLSLGVPDWMGLHSNKRLPPEFAQGWRLGRAVTCCVTVHCPLKAYGALRSAFYWGDFFIFWSIYIFFFFAWWQLPIGGNSSSKRSKNEEQGSQKSVFSHRETFSDQISLENEI